MAHHRSKALLILAGLAAAASPAFAQYYDELSRSDGIAISAGDAKAANLAIQTPTPWPPYVNNVTIPGIGRHGAAIVENFYKKYDAPAPSTGSTIINIGQ